MDAIIPGERVVMSKLINDDKWVWVIIQNPGLNEKLLGQYDEKNEISFIPVFLDKESAEYCKQKLVLQKSVHEIQAIYYEDLIKQVVEKKFMLFILNSEGKVLEKINPEIIN